VLWGKSNAGGRPNLLVQHLLDTAAVAELMWAQFLAPSVRDDWDVVTEGRGSELFTLLCGLHDLGKASPAFQSKAPDLAAPVQAAGLTWRELNRNEQAWHHTLAGAKVIMDDFPGWGWDRDAVGWVWPFLAGHHGKVPSASRLRPPGLGGCHGAGPGWRDARRAVVDLVAGQLDVDLRGLASVRPASRAAQLALLGGLVMADWLASNDQHFPGIDRSEDVSLAKARERAAAGWKALGLRGGWAPASLPHHDDVVQSRFARPARPSQVDLVALAKQVPSPCLLIVEAPMGEGKTEAALAAVEVMARRFGADGLFVGMPTQATSDPMFARVRRWAESVDSTVPIALLHGKARFNPEWRDLRRGDIRITGVDEYGCVDEYSLGSSSWAAASGQAPAEWFLGNKRGLLTPIVVGTVDQLLHAVTRTRHVMLRHAGLAGKIVVLDEVHAYDVYMSQFLHEALRWLAGAGVPVVVLSATLPPATRAELARSYLQGVLGSRDVDLGGLPIPRGYPSALSVCAVDGEPQFEERASLPWRRSARFGVEVLPEADDSSVEPVVSLLHDRMVDGGCALVIRNTVGRAQQTYLALRDTFGDNVVLLHARLTARERADRTQRVLDHLGPPTSTSTRPRRLVVVATQLAEQSFDVDVDLLVTDLAPIDLLLQRAGRLHRHDRPPGVRPTSLREPQIVVTGLRVGTSSAPVFPAGSRFVYGDHLLLRAAALVFETVAETGWWSIPADVPDLVQRGYDDALQHPAAWAEAVQAASAKWQDEQATRAARAEQFLLAGPDQLGLPTMAGLHERDVAESADLDDEDTVAAVVRDGDPSIEVILVRRDDRGYLTLDGRPLGPTGEAVTNPDVLEIVVGDCVRLPAQPSLTASALAELKSLPGWAGDPWLARARALVLGQDGATDLGGWHLAYDRELGLMTHRQTRSKGQR
jgi:CRISPR-associated endonuclease/helicase Cas3